MWQGWEGPRYRPADIEQREAPIFLGKEQDGQTVIFSTPEGLIHLGVQLIRYAERGFVEIAFDATPERKSGYRLLGFGVVTDDDYDALIAQAHGTAPDPTTKRGGR